MVDELDEDLQAEQNAEDESPESRKRKRKEYRPFVQNYNPVASRYKLLCCNKDAPELEGWMTAYAWKKLEAQLPGLPSTFKRVSEGNIMLELKDLAYCTFYKRCPACGKTTFYSYEEDKGIGDPRVKSDSDMMPDPDTEEAGDKNEESGDQELAKEE